MFKILSLSLLLLINISCNLLKKDYPEIAHAITLRTAKELRDEKGMKLTGTGGGMIDQVNSLEMDLDYYSPLEISEARKLALFVVDKFLSNINRDEKVRPYLKKYPFEAEGLKIFLSFYYSNGTLRQVGELDHIVIHEGRLYYNSCSESRKLPYVRMLEETITEAREKVRLEKLKTQP